MTGVFVALGAVVLTVLPRADTTSLVGVAHAVRPECAELSGTELTECEARFAESGVGGTCNDVVTGGTDQREIVSNNGFIAFLCGNKGTSGDTRNAVVVIIENIATYVLGISTYIFAVMIILGVVQMGVAGGSPGGIQSAKNRITLAVTSIAFMWLGRLFLDLTGVTGGNFLGVPVSSGFNKDTIPLIIAAFMQYLTFIGGALSVTFIIIGGIRMMTSAGNPNGLKQAGKIITYAVISLVAIGSLNLIFQLISLVITGSQAPWG